MLSTNKPFFYFESLKSWEKWSIGIYIVITIALIINYNFVDASGKRNLLVIYTISGQLFIIFFLYTSLRNLSSYLIWCLIGGIHWIWYFSIKDNQSLQMGRGNASNCLKYTLLLLLAFQLLRFISIKLQGREFIVPGKGQDMFENKKVSYLDYIISFAFVILWLTVITISLKKT